MTDFEKNIIGIYGEKGKEWLSKLPEMVFHFETQWNLTQLTPVSHLTYNYVLSGFQNKTPIVLKLSLDTQGLQREVNALDAFKEYGAVSLLDKQQNAILLHRAIPGLTLKDSQYKQNIEIACNVAKKLHTASIPKNNHFPHISELLATLDTEWKIPQEHLSKARDLKHQLLKTPKESCVLLHGDLHQDNILSNGEEWLVIDPKGVIGHPINDLWACVENSSYDLRFISEFFGYPFDTVAKWYYVHLVLAACWQVEDNLDPSSFLKRADQISFLLKK